MGNDIEPNKIYLSNVPYDATEQALRDLCADFGKVVSVALPTDKDTGKPRGFAFVGFETEAQAKDAQQTLDSSMFGGRTLRVSFAKKRQNDRKQGKGQRRER
jgi:RNA recognition motif-containing protein